MNGIIGAASLASVTRQVYSVPYAARLSPSMPFAQKRARERRTYQLLISSTTSSMARAASGTRTAARCPSTAFTVLCNYYAKPKLLFDVPPGCFMTQPKVTSAVVRMDRRTAPPAIADDEKFFFRTVRAAFAQRRKTLPNALRSGLSELNREDINAAVEEVGLPLDVRGEALAIAQFAALSNALLRKFNK